MEITGTYIFNADQQTVWKVLMDPDAIARALPGVDAMIPVEGEEMTWRTVAKIGVATVNGTYSSVIRMSEVEPPNQYRLTVSGEGQQSIIGGTALLKLTYDADNNYTILTWDAHADISGKLASIGQRLIKSAAALLSRQFFGALEKQIPTADRNPS